VGAVRELVGAFLKLGSSLDSALSASGSFAVWMRSVHAVREGLAMSAQAVAKPLARPGRGMGAPHESEAKLRRIKPVGVPLALLCERWLRADHSATSRPEEQPTAPRTLPRFFTPK
jgi:hypothetical protein